MSGRLLCDILHDNLKSVMLGHLSKENNYAELAYETVKLEVTLGDNPYKGDEIPLAVAKRDQSFGYYYWYNQYIYLTGGRL